MIVPNDDVDQLVCAYDPDNPSNNMGFGPVASSFSVDRAVALFNDAGPVLRPAGSPADSIAYERLPSGQELVVRRVVVLDDLQRGNLFSQALIAPAGQFGAELALGLDHDDWPLGDEVTRVGLNERLDRVDGFLLAHKARQGAERLRDVVRSADHTGVLCDMTAALLAEPSRRLSLTTAQVGDRPRAVLLGLVDLLTPLLPDPWFFSTLESAESRSYRVIVLRNWPHEGSPDYGRLRLGGQRTPDSTVRGMAEALVVRYQKYGREGLDLLKSRQDWHGMDPVRRVQTLWTTLAVASDMTPHKALPRGTAVTEPGAKDIARDANRALDDELDPVAHGEPFPGQGIGTAASFAGPPPGPDGTATARQDGRGPEPTGTGAEPHEHPVPDRTSGGNASSAAGGAEAGRPGDSLFLPAPPTPPLTRGFTHPPVAGSLSVADRETRLAPVNALVQRVFTAHGHEERRRLVSEVRLRTDGWTDEEADAAAVTAIGCRLGLPKQRGRTGRGRQTETKHFAFFYELLVRQALSRQPAALAWAAFLRQEASAGFREPLRSVVERMYAEHRHGDLAVHHAFFIALGKGALLDALGGKPAASRRTPGRIPPRPGRPASTHGKGGNRIWRPRAPRPARADGPADEASGGADVRAGLAEDLLRLGKALFGVVVLLSAGTALLFLLVLGLGLL
ncbi:hypothetical protein CW362_22050 [Streptomyces populi]|uniref:Uncharacterized protein n=1 Tax=Streptomyces populi TaxID=2058924 RepID=A0A2I0SLM7_9ACTN|nr:hypothetical protein [Streptomyces populi]PKT70829.1 hypothetical protein CW362_22050 [Streptomyces populi]